MITELQFRKYVYIQKSGATNMFDVNTVVLFSCGVLNKEMCFEIMKTYDTLSEKYPEVI